MILYNWLRFLALLQLVAPHLQGIFEDNFDSLTHNQSEFMLMLMLIVDYFTEK